MRMPSKKGLISAGLHPPDEQLCIGITEKATNVSPDKWQSSDIEGQKHGRGDLQMSPVRGVVPGPYGSVPLAAGKEGAAENKSAMGGLGFVSGDESLVRGLMEEHAV